VLTFCGQEGGFHMRMSALFDAKNFGFFKIMVFKIMDKGGGG